MSLVEETALRIEALFETAHAGEPRAFFEKDGKRCIYRVYSFIGNMGTDKELADALVNVFERIKGQGGRHLYWRRPLELNDFGSRRCIYARVGVLNAEGDDVTVLPDYQENLAGRCTRDVNSNEFLED